MSIMQIFKEMLHAKRKFAECVIIDNNENQHALRCMKYEYELIKLHASPSEKSFRVSLYNQINAIASTRSHINNINEWKHRVVDLIRSFYFVSREVVPLDTDQSRAFVNEFQCIDVVSNIDQFLKELHTCPLIISDRNHDDNEMIDAMMNLSAHE